MLVHPEEEAMVIAISSVLMFRTDELLRDWGNIPFLIKHLSSSYGEFDARLKLQKYYLGYKLTSNSTALNKHANLCHLLAEKIKFNALLIIKEINPF